MNFDHVSSPVMDPTQLEEIFQIFDTKGDGCIELKSVGEVLRSMGLNPTEADISRCCEPLKEDPKNARISFDVFMPIYHQIAKNSDRYSFDEIVDGLRNFDTDGSGQIASAELRHLLSALGEKLTEDEVDEVMSLADIDEQGKITYESFVKKIMSG